MHEIIASRRNADKKVDRHDLLSSLLDANDNSSEGGSGLTDQELLGECRSIFCGQISYLPVISQLISSFSSLPARLFCTYSSFTY